ncbi:MAG: DUF6760 family protein [bacterium]
MPSLRGRVRRGAPPAGGSLSYPSDRLREEVAYLAHYLHWPYETVMAMSHLERAAWVRQTAHLNEEIGRAQQSDATVDVGTMMASTRRR